MKRILLAVLGISACTTLSLFAAKSDNGCPKCKAQSQVAAYSDDDDDNEEEAMKPTIAPEGRRPQNEEGVGSPGVVSPSPKEEPGAIKSSGSPAGSARIKMNVERLGGMQGNIKAQRSFLKTLPTRERDRTIRAYNERNPDDRISY